MEFPFPVRPLFGGEDYSCWDADRLVRLKESQREKMAQVLDTMGRRSKKVCV
jgi:hypothetical protein